MSRHQFNVIEVAVPAAALPASILLTKPFTVRLVASSTPKCLIFLGFSVESAAARQAARLLAARGWRDFAVVSPFPYWRLRQPDAAALEAVATAGVRLAAEACQKHFGQAVTHAIAESQAAPGVILACVHDSRLFAAGVGLLHPLGLITQTKRTFTYRIARGTFDWQLLLDHWVPYMTIVGGWRLLQDALSGGYHFRHGLATDVRSALAQLYVQRPGRVYVVAGQHDRIFPLADVTTVLQAINASDMLTTIPGGHYAPATRAGARQVEAVLRLFRLNRCWPAGLG